MKRSGIERKTTMARGQGFKAKPPGDKPPKSKRCKAAGCHERYTPDPARPFVVWCGPDCGAAIGEQNLARAREAKARAERVDDRKRKRAMMTRAALIAEAQQAFNEFIRFRDRDLPCICCNSFDAGGAGKPGGGWDAGHYISRGHAPHLRFDERNVHKQRKGCNKPGGTTRAKYRAGLVARIGAQAVAELEALEYAPVSRDMGKDEIVAVRDLYRAKLAALKKSTT